MKQTLMGQLVSQIDLSWLFKWFVTYPINTLWSPIIELWIICALIVQGFILSLVIVIGSETQSFYFDKEYPVDLSFLLAIDFVFETDLANPYIDEFYPRYNGTFIARPKEQ